MKNNVQTERSVMEFVAPSGGVTSGVGLVVGNMFNVPTVSAAQTEVYVGMVEGTVRLPKATGVAWARGAKLYWNPTNGNVTTATTSGNFPIGVAANVRASGDTTAEVRLDGIASTAL